MIQYGNCSNHAMITPLSSLDTPWWTIDKMMDDTVTAWQCHMTMMGWPVTCTVRTPLTPTLLLCLILNLGATPLSVTWQPFNKQLISTPVACMVQTPLTPTRCYITGNHSTNNWFPPAQLPAQNTHGSPPPSSPCIQVPCCCWRCGNQMLNNQCCHSLLSMGRGQDEDTATTHNTTLLLLIDIQVVPVDSDCSIERLVQTEGQTSPRLAIDPCLYPWQVTDPCNPSYPCTHTCELPWPSQRVQVIMMTPWGYPHQSLLIILD